MTGRPDPGLTATLGWALAPRRTTGLMIGAGTVLGGMRRGVRFVDETGVDIVEGTVEVRKKLRPNVRGGKIVLTVEPIGDAEWRARKLL